MTVLARRIVPPELPIIVASEPLARLTDVVVRIYVSPNHSRSGVAESFADLFVASAGKSSIIERLDEHCRKVHGSNALGARFQPRMPTAGGSFLVEEAMHKNMCLGVVP